MQYMSEEKRELKMSAEQVINIIKGAILLERKGKAFYETIARQTQSNAVRKIFQMMAKEEDKHIEILTEHYNNFLQEKKFAHVQYDKTPENVSKTVLTEKIKQEISAAGYEAAAISAAMAMEERAVQYYTNRAKSTDDASEKELYEWLSNWEKTHLQFLSDIDKELQESVWYDNNFWPVV